MASFLSGLVGGYSNAMISKHQKERDEEDKKAQAELSVLQTAISTGRLTPEAQSAAFDRMDEIVSDYGGKKSGVSIKNLIGKFQDVGQQNGGKKGGQQQTPQGNGGGAQKQSGAAGAAPAKPTAAGAMPTRQSPFQFKTDEQISDEQIAAKVKETHAMADQVSQDIFDKPLAKLNPTEKQQVMRFVYKMPDTKVHPITLQDANGKPVPAMQYDDGTVIGPGGIAIADPIEWKPKKARQSRVNIGPGGKLQPAELDVEDGKVYDANTGEVIEHPNLAPPASYLPTTSSSTSVEPSEAVDPNTGKVVIGPAISRQTSTTHSKQGLGDVPSRPSKAATSPAAAASAPPTRASSSNGAKPAAAPLPWAQPKNIGTQYSQGITTMRQTRTEATAALAKATKALADLKKEDRGAGLMKKSEQLAGITRSPSKDIAAATEALRKAGAKADSANEAVDYMEKMRQSILDGTYSIEAVVKAAQELAETGSYPPGSPGLKVTRKN